MRNVRKCRKKNENGKQNCPNPSVDHVTWTEHDPSSLLSETTFSMTDEGACWKRWFKLRRKGQKGEVERS